MLQLAAFFLPEAPPERPTRLFPPPLVSCSGREGTSGDVPVVSHHILSRFRLSRCEVDGVCARTWSSVLKGLAEANVEKKDRTGHGFPCPSARRP